VRVMGGQVKKIANDGDCFYRCVATTVPRKGDAGSEECEQQQYDVAELRKTVSSRLDEETLEHYQALAEAKVEGYTWSEGLTVSEARAAIAGDMERGPRVFAPRYCDTPSGDAPPSKRARKPRAVWADEWAINVLLEELNLVLLLYQSSGASEPFTRITPLFREARWKERERLEDTRRVLLVEKKPGHYNLLEHNGISVFPMSELPGEIADLWSSGCAHA